MSVTLLQVRDLLIERGELPLFRPLDLDIVPGDLIAIEADNGVGKTSLLRALAGLLPITSGSLTPGRSPLSLRLMAHQLAIKGLLNVLENLRFWSALDGARASDDAISAALAHFGLAGFEYQLGHTLSAGQRKRVALARLHLNPGELWLLDEPFANLDASGCALVAAAIHHHREQHGAVLLTSHGSLPVDLDVRRLRLEAQH